MSSALSATTSASEWVRPTLLSRLKQVHYHGPGFDLLRLVAASVVVLHHSLDVNFNKVTIDPIYRFGHQHYHSGFLAVATFFAISGFLVTPGLMRTENLLAFAIKRALRILPLLALVVFLSIILVGPLLTNLPLVAYFTHGSVYEYAANVLTSMRRYLPGVVDSSGAPHIINGSLWTLRFEVLAYIALAGLCLVGILRARWLYLGVLSLFYLISAASLMAPATVAFFPASFLTFTGLFAYFGVGVAFYLFSEFIVHSRVVAVGALALTALSLPVGLAPLVMPLALAYSVILFGLSENPLPRPLAGFDLSYGIYLTHGPIMLLTTSLLPLPRTWWVVFIITLGIAAVISALTWRFVEQPALKRKDTLVRIATAPVERIGQLLPSAIRLIRATNASDPRKPARTAGDVAG